MGMREAGGALSSAKANYELGVIETNDALKSNDELLKMLSLILTKVRPLQAQDFMGPLYGTWEAVGRVSEALADGHQDIMYAKGRSNSLPTILGPLHDKSREVATAISVEAGESCRTTLDALYESLTEVTSALAVLVERAEAAQTHAVVTKQLLERTAADGGAIVTEIGICMPRRLA